MAPPADNSADDLTADDHDAAALRDRVAALEQTVAEQQATIESLSPPTASRRGVLAALTGVAGAGALGAYSQRASAQAAGQVGTQSEPVDAEIYDLNLQGTANGLAENPLTGDLDAGGNSLTNVASVEVASVTSDSVNTDDAINSILDRSRWTTEQTTVTVAKDGTGDYDSIQLAIDNVPNDIDHEYVIDVADGDYSDEDLNIQQISARQNPVGGTKENSFRIVGNETSPTNVKIGSAFFGTCQGSIIRVKGFAVQNDTPFNDESVPLAAHHSEEIYFGNILFEGGTNGIISYNADVELFEVDFGSNVLSGDGQIVKHNGKIMEQRAGGAAAVGNVGGHARRPTKGEISKDPDSTLTGDNGQISSTLTRDGEVTEEIESGTERRYISPQSHSELEVRDETLISATIDSDQPISAGDWEAMPLTADKDERGEFDDASGRFIPDKTSYYWVTWQVRLSDLTDGDRVGTRIRKPGETIYFNNETVGSASGDQNAKLVALVELTTDSEYEFQTIDVDNDATVKSSSASTLLGIRRALGRY